MVTAPTGDPEYFFTYRCLDSSGNNDGRYHSDQLESLAEEMSRTFDPAHRQELAVEMQQVILEDHAFVFGLPSANEHDLQSFGNGTDSASLRLLRDHRGPGYQRLRRRTEKKDEELLSYRAVEISYNGIPAVRDVSFTLQPGEILGIVGSPAAEKAP